MDQSVIDLFQYTRSKVTEQDIIDFSPGDPGYPSYVRLWSEILRSGVVPEKTDFDLSEVIGLTGWARPVDYKQSERFRCYRRFTSAVGVGLLHHGNDAECVRVANYLARDLIIDLDTESARHLELLRSVAESTRSILGAAYLDEGFPFFTFMSMILAQRAGDWKASEIAAECLIEDEKMVRDSESLKWLIQDDRFLMGLSTYDQLHKDWIAFARGLKNPNGHEETQLVIDSICLT